MSGLASGSVLGSHDPNCSNPSSNITLSEWIQILRILHQVRLVQFSAQNLPSSDPNPHWKEPNIKLQWGATHSIDQASHHEDYAVHKTSGVAKIYPQLKRSLFIRPTTSPIYIQHAHNHWLMVFK